jgi:hypothetical protein
MRAAHLTRALVRCVLPALAAAAAFATRAETFDLLGYTPPAGWQRSNGNGVVLDGTWGSSSDWQESNAGANWTGRPLIRFARDGRFASDRAGA